MGTLSPVHWIVVIIVVLLLFGPKRIAGVGKGLGEGIRSLKKALSDDSEAESGAERKQLSEKRSP